ncbi:MAG TPA: lysoplasmalogenase [Hyphomonadaceae bacterium]|nr:lysoplasmalogenase [Hyphomonadaceae bacterium]HPN06620.1 lysoplasmalogenase [Hyphomonadaceae bacterium]
MTDTAARSPTNILFLAGALLAASHLANEWVRLDLPLGPVWKCSGIVVLGLYALSQRAILVGLGLLFSAAGDVLLELDGLFVGGMAAFGLAHVCYTAAFITIIRRDGLNKSGWPIAVAVIAATIALAIWFAPGQAEKGLTIPATTYSIIISIMVISAVMSKAPLMAKLGAIIFMLSDTLIAVGMFAKQPVPIGSVWITYAAAQIMLAWSLSRRT